MLENLRLRLADTEARLAQARAREALLARQLLEMKRFLSVMEILEDTSDRRCVWYLIHAHVLLHALHRTHVVTFDRFDFRKLLLVFMC